MVAFVVGKLLKIDKQDILETISNFKALPYRMEFIGNIEGVKYYVDTLATIPEATEEAIKAIEDIDTLVFGGMDRGINYTEFVTFLQNSKVRNFICMPKTGYDIGNKLQDNKFILRKQLKKQLK